MFGIGSGCMTIKIKKVKIETSMKPLFLISDSTFDLPDFEKFVSPSCHIKTLKKNTQLKPRRKEKTTRHFLF